MSDIFHNFKNLRDWCAYSQNDHPNDGNMFTRSSHNPDFNWAGVKKRDDAYNMFLMGWPEGLHRMKSIVESLQRDIILPTTIEEFVCDVQGCSPNVEAFIQGQPEDMFVTLQTEVDAPPSHIVLQFELTYHCGISALQATWAGSTIFAAMEALRAQGCNVTILMTHTICDHYREGEKMQFSAPIPSNIDLDSLCFLFTHPSVFRVMIFSAMEHEPAEVRRQFGCHNGGGYGYPSHLKNPLAHTMLQMAQVVRDLNGYDDATMLPLAQALLKRMVDTRFGTKPLDLTPA